MDSRLENNDDNICDKHTENQTEQYEKKEGYLIYMRSYLHEVSMGICTE